MNPTEFFKVAAFSSQVSMQQGCESYLQIFRAPISIQKISQSDELCHFRMSILEKVA